MIVTKEGRPHRPAIDVVVVDRHEMVCEGLELLLSRQPGIRVAATAGTASEATELAAHHRPDVMLIDIELPDADGPHILHDILALDASPRALVLTASEADEHVHGALRAGASGYLLKNGDRDELVAAVRSVAAGDAYLAPAVTRRLIDGLARQRTTAVLPNVVDTLTDRENEVLKLVAEGRSNGEIADALVVAEQTVKSHVSSIFAKIGVRDRAQAIIFSYEHSLVAVS